MPLPSIPGVISDGKRAVFHLAKDRQSFLLEIQRPSNPSLDIAFPIEWLPDLIAQLSNIQARLEPKKNPPKSRRAKKLN